jgi:photosystem II stability/assembly factor-like uncharacterized protein
VKTQRLLLTRYLVAASLTLAAVALTCYAGGNARRVVARGDVRIPRAAPTDGDRDPEYLVRRQDFAKRFFGGGPEGVSPTNYMKGRAAAAALPQSPLMGNQSFTSAQTPQSDRWWTLPHIYPIEHSYGGNAGAMVHALAIDPVNPSIVYTGSFGGLAKTTDNGFTWQYLSDAWISQSVSAIAVDPNAPNVVYAGTGREDYGPYDVGIYRSSDRGTSWSSPMGGEQFAGAYVRTIVIDPNASGSQTSTILYAATTSGLWCSTDSGTTWTQKRQEETYDVAVDGSSFPSTLYVTDDSGTYKSTDSGDSWNWVHDVLLNSYNRVAIVKATLPQQSSAVYLLGPGDPDHNLYKSTDRGATWSQIPTGCPQDADSCDDAEGNIGFQVFAVDPFNKQTILGGNSALYRTTDEGATWAEIGHWWGDPDPSHSLHTDQRVIAFSNTVSGVVYSGNDGGVVSSINHGLDWTNLNQNLPGALVYSIATSADGSMMAGTQDNGVIFSSAGAQWEMVAAGDSSHDLIDPSDSTWAYYVIYDRESFTRVNTVMGQSINIAPAELQRDADCAFFPVFSMNQSSPKHLLAACQQVVRTLDATASPVAWTPIGGSLAEHYGNYVTAAAEAPSNPDVIYAVRNENAVFVTWNAGQGTGAEWTQASETGDLNGIHAVSVDPTDPRTAYLASNSGVYKTTDMGATWVEEGIPDLVYHDLVIDPANPKHIFAASNAGVFASTNGGVTWGSMNRGIPTGVVVTALSFNATNRHLAAATFGRGVYVLKHVELVARPRPTPHPRP